MTAFSDLLQGFATVLSPVNLIFALVGVTLGTFVGVLPGIGPALTIALLLPVTYGLDDPAGAFIMFAGIYYGAMYGGSTTSILLNTPGERHPSRPRSRGIRWPDGGGRARHSPPPPSARSLPPSSPRCCWRSS